MALISLTTKDVHILLFSLSIFALEIKLTVCLKYYFKFSSVFFFGGVGFLSKQWRVAIWNTLDKPGYLLT